MLKRCCFAIETLAPRAIPRSHTKPQGRVLNRYNTSSVFAAHNIRDFLMAMVSQYSPVTDEPAAAASTEPVKLKV